MTTVVSTLTCVEVEYVRAARCRRRRTPRYVVRFRFDGHAPTYEAAVDHAQERTEDYVRQA